MSNSKEQNEKNAKYMREIYYPKKKLDPLWVETHREYQKNNMRKYRLLGGKDFKERENTRARKLTMKYKTAVFNHYGWECACCGETCRLFLSIDHINNDGNKFRDIGIGSGLKTYAYIIKNNFPIDLQTLCMNCNWGKARNGGICPHIVSTV